MDLRIFAMVKVIFINLCHQKGYPNIIFSHLYLLRALRTVSIIAFYYEPSKPIFFRLLEK